MVCIWSWDFIVIMGYIMLLVSLLVMVLVSNCLFIRFLWMEFLILFIF